MGWSHGVPNMRTFSYNFKRYALKFSPEEIKSLLMTIVLSAFIYSFNQWGGAKFNFFEGLINLTLAIIMFAICLFFMLVGQRTLAIYYGYDPEYQHSMLGLLIGLIIAFASRGSLVIFFPGYTMIHHLAASRLGEFRYYTSSWEWAKISFLGIIMNFFLAAILSLTPYKNIAFLANLMHLNLWFAFFAVLPIPMNPGFYIFFTHRSFWMFCAGFVVAGSALLLVSNFLIATAGALVIGILAIYWYFFNLQGVSGT